MRRNLAREVTRLGALYGALASLIFPALYGVMLWGVARAQVTPSPHALSDAIRFLSPLWLITLPGAVAAGIATGHLVSRGYIRHVVTVGAAALGLAVINAGIGGVLNSVTGNPIGLGGGAAHGEVAGGFIGGALAFVLFFPVTVPMALGVGILLRNRVLLLCEPAPSDS